MIHGIFYARFLIEKGIKVIYQSPPGCAVPEPGSKITSNVLFEAIQEYIIPRQAFCNRYITVNCPDDKYKILGYPVLIKDEKYDRNEFMFNFCLIVPKKYDTLPYENVVRRLADTFREMEIQCGYLSKEGSVSGKPIWSLLEIIREDLNNYNECMIPIDSATTINTKLFPIRPEPPIVRAWHVPLARCKFSDIVDDKWDLTMRKVIPEIDGIRDVRKIAHEANVSLSLTKLTIRHLLYYDTVILLDMFFFSNIYVVTPGINDLMANKDGMLEECSRYVMIDNHKISNFWLQKMFTTFQQGRTVKDWLKLHLDSGFDILKLVDVRRFVQFGVIKGILYRQQKWAVSKQRLATMIQSLQADSEEDTHDELIPAYQTTGIWKYVDGIHSFDQISVEMNKTDAEIMQELGKLPPRDVEILYR